MISVRVFLMDSARALPRPSARDSAKVAKITVSQSQTETIPVNQAGSPFPVTRLKTKLIVVITLPDFDRQHDRIPPEGAWVKLFEGICERCSSAASDQIFPLLFCNGFAMTKHLPA